MRKRRFPTGGVNEALQTLRTTVTAAAATQKRVPASIAAPVPSAAPLPAGISALNELGTLGTLSDADLEKSQQEIPTTLERVESELEAWQDSGKQSRSALDAALSIITLKSEPSFSKRRRTAITHEGFAEDPYAADNVKEEVASDAASAEPSYPSTPGESTAPETEAEESDANEVKLEDMAERNTAGQLSPLVVGRQVAFKVPKSAVDEWIQCVIIKVIVPGSRFEVQDPEPDDDGNPGKTYIARRRDIMPLPLPDQPIKPIPNGSVVFARYPDTTAFYKARVTRYSAKKRAYYLRFEGEEDAHKEIEVSDSLVIMSPKGRR